ncbi:MAG: TIR domain-containing protein [Pseudonocardia sp.]
MSLSPLAQDRPARTYDVFISYRRVEANYLAGWLHHYFASRLGYGRVFLDIDAIRPGFEFMSVIHAAIAEAKVMLVLIGPHWATRPDGTSRLTDPSDPVRIEVEAAFARDLLVIPLLLDGASLPGPAQLPPSMTRLLDLHAVPISRDMFRERLDDLVQVIADVLPTAGELLPPPEDAPPGPAPKAHPTAVRRDAEQRSRLLTKLSQIYGDYLRQALHDDRILRMSLRLQAHPEKVRRPADVLLPLGGRTGDRAPQEGRLLTKLDEAGGMDGDGLLVLGGPGAGKSTALVELAVELLQQAVEDPDHPVPVYLPLKHWATRRLPVATWVVHELVELYEVPGPIAERWTRGRQLLFLLDGLDELPRREQRAACVAGINGFQRFGRQYRLPLVVTTRQYEYDTLPEPLELENAVEILPLSPDVVERRLTEAGPTMQGVLQALDNDPGMRPMLASPLMLGMITRTYADEGPATDVAADGGADRLFTDYVSERFALERRTGRTRSNAYPPERTTRWLSALAQVMTAQQQAVFVLGKLPSDWLPGRGGRWIVDVVPGLVVGVACLAPWGIFPDFRSALYACLIVVLAAAVTAPALETLRLPGPTAWTWSLRAVSSRLRSSMVVAVTLSVAFALVDVVAVAHDGVVPSLVTASLGERLAGIGVAVVLLSGVVHRTGARRGQWVGRRRAFRWAVFVGITLALSSGAARTITGGPAAGAMLAMSWVLLSGIGAWLVGMSGPAERVSWSWRLALRPATPIVLAVVAGTVAFGVYAASGPWDAAIEAAFTLAACTAAVAVLVAGFTRAGIPVYATPNEATWRSFRSGVLVGIGVFVLLGCVAGGLVLLFVPGPFTIADVIAVAVAFGFQLAIVIAMSYGLGSVAQHWTLRVLLWRAGIAPIRYGRWLDYAVSLKLLYRSGGGGYLFVHGLLQDHLAQADGRANGGFGTAG